MPLELDEILVVAQVILDRLGHNDIQWAVIEAAPIETPGHDLPGSGLQTPQTVLVRAVKSSDPSCAINSYFVLGIPTQQAIVQLASSLQDEVIETIGAAVPICPGHSHPLSARLERGRAVWACPLGIGPREPVSDIDQGG